MRVEDIVSRFRHVLDDYHARLEDQIGSILRDRMQRPYPLHLCSIQHERYADVLRLHDGQEIQLRRFYLDAGETP